MFNLPQIFLTSRERLSGHRYRPLSFISQSDKDEGDFDTEEAPVDHDTQRPSRASPVSTVLLVLGLACFAMSCGKLLYAYKFNITELSCLKKMSAYSPLHDVAEFDWVQFDANYHPDEYSGKPEVPKEILWNDLWDYGAFKVPFDKLGALNKSSLDNDFRTVDDGSGVGGLLEAAHQIHCLNLVRQFIYQDYRDYSHIPSFSGGEKVRRHHVDHCIMTLKMNIECRADVTPLLLKGSFNEPGLMSYERAPQLCWNFQKLTSWVKQNEIFNDVAH